MYRSSACNYDDMQRMMMVQVHLLLSIMIVTMYIYAVNGDGVCDELEVNGCTDSSACYYDDAATDDDGSCTYPAKTSECNEMFE